MNEQQMFWGGEEGDKYTKRNPQLTNFEYINGDRLKITQDIFNNIPRDSSILELGCNTGNIIRILHDMGFTDITGLDINKNAIKIISKEFPEYKFIHSSIEDYKPDAKFDMVYTSGFLIHIHPDNLKPIIDKIKSISRKYIFGFEYYSEEFEDISYHKKVESDQLCWTGNYAKLINMKIKRMDIYKTKQGGRAGTHCFYLLEK